MSEKRFKKYRKKPIIVEAYQTDEEKIIETLEGKMKANKGDYIIKGIKGELYPCKADIFYETYDKVENDTQYNEVARLKEENEQLQKELDNFKPVMFQDMRKGTIILYSKGDIDE